MSQIIDTSESMKRYSLLCRYWTLKLLTQMGGYKSYLTNFGCSEDELFESLEIPLEDNDENYSFSRAMNSLQQALIILEKSPPKIPAGTNIAKNLEWLKINLGLSDVEKMLLLFFVLERQDPILRKGTESLGDINSTKLIAVLANITGISEARVREALHPQSRLRKTGLVSFSNRYLQTFPEKISLLKGFSDQMTQKHSEPFKLFIENFKAGEPAHLDPENFPHLKSEINQLSCYLRQANKDRKQGINILLYGEPGSGKTEFVRMLAKQIGFQLFEVASESLDGSAIAPGDRLRSCVLSQIVLENSCNPVLMFDEIEDVFNATNEFDESTGGNSNRSGAKIWINNLLESNKVVTFWITNKIWMIDPAHLRRFDYHLEMKVPPRYVREQIIEEYTSGLKVSRAWREAVAELDFIPPAVMEKANKVASAILLEQPQLSAEKIMGDVLSGSLQAMGLGSVKINPEHDLIDYHLDLVNANCDLEELTWNLAAHPEARICLYGPPGTGKTAFGRHFSKSFFKPLMVKRGSDIVSPYLGVTERNIARMFQEAEESGSVLLLDEADSFLQERSGAVRSWEITAVNEMLTQMESFNGVFIASTNLMDQLDSASLRRFDLKIEFGYLKPEQSLSLYANLAEKLHIDLEGFEASGLKQLDNLTPGDFANVARQARLIKIKNSREFLSRIEAECKAKPGHKTGRIGFAA